MPYSVTTSANHMVTYGWMHHTTMKTCNNVVDVAVCVCVCARWCRKTSKKDRRSAGLFDTSSLLYASNCCNGAFMVNIITFKELRASEMYASTSVKLCQELVPAMWVQQKHLERSCRASIFKTLWVDYLIRACGHTNESFRFCWKFLRARKSDKGWNTFLRK